MEEKPSIPLQEEATPVETGVRGWQPASISDETIGSKLSMLPSSSICEDGDDFHHEPDGDLDAPEDPATEAPPLMNVCLLIVGTRGDVQPFLAIALRLQQDGHRVRLATHAIYRSLVMSHGVEFYPLGGDPKELAAYMVKTGGQLLPLKVETLQKDVPRNMRMLDEILHSTWPAVSAADPEGGGGVGFPGEPFRAHAIISNPVTYGHIHVAEKLGVPLHIMFPQPWVPTAAFPHPLSGLAYTDKPPQKRNRLSYKLVDLVMWQGTAAMVNAFRADVLKLRKIRTGDGGRDLLLALRIPHSFLWTPELVPKPADWSDLYDVVGTVTLNKTTSETDYSPSPELDAFLGIDAGPIFVGFGSMVLQDASATTRMIIEAATLARTRVLIQSNWSNMAEEGLAIPANVFFVGNCPHDWLLPRVCAVVHHGGAGTTAAGLLAGKPTFIVPFFGDQPFWGQAVAKAGVGVEPCPIAELTVARLHAAFEALQSRGIRARAEAMKLKMQREDGATQAVTSFYRHLPVQQMLCDLDGKLIASKWSVTDQIKMCDACAFVVGSRAENRSKVVVDYHCVDYTARGPNSWVSGLSSGAGSLVHEVSGAVKDVLVGPARGFHEEGVKGVVIGVAHGLGGLAVRPVRGVTLFAERIAAGHANHRRGEGGWKRKTVFGTHVLTALGVEGRAESSYTYGQDPGEAEQRCRAHAKHAEPQIVVPKVAAELKRLYQSRFRELIGLPSIEQSATLVERDASRLSSTRATDPFTSWARENVLPEFGSKPIPPMNLCLATIGNNVKQYIALGLRLAADGHRVRVATKEKYRQAVVARGLEFYPLGGELENFGVFVEYLESAKRTAAFKRRANRRHLLKAFKDLVYSLLPAAIGTDPHGYGDQIPGEFFRADALLWHPLLFGHLHVAEYLGIPLQCASVVPFSPTSAFGPILSSCFRDDLDALSSGHKAANWQSYSEVDTALWHGMVAVVNQFRSSLGLTGRCHEPTPFGQWGIPHVYLWSPAVLQAPSDWGAELAVTGYFTLEDELERDELEEFERNRSLDAFALTSGDPVLFFGLSTFGFAPRSLRTLLRTIDAAAQSACVQIILQLREWQDPGQEPYRSTHVFEVESGFPYALILRKVAATIHWGEVALVEEGLRAGKPVCVCAQLSTQYFAARKAVATGVGIPPIDLKTCTMNTLVSSFRGLLQPALQERAQALAKTFDPSRALEQAIRAFYGNLPLRAMRCDLDDERIARIYDPHYQLKLSLEAYLAIKAMRTHDDKDDVAYRPVSYSGRRRNKRRFRGPRDELPPPMAFEPAPRRIGARPLQRTANELTAYSRHAVEGVTVLLFRGLRSIGLAHSAVAALDPTRGSSMALPRPMRPQRSSSIALVTEAPSFWTTEAQEEAAREAVNKSYEKAMARRIPTQSN